MIICNKYSEHFPTSEGPGLRGSPRRQTYVNCAESVTRARIALTLQRASNNNAKLLSSCFRISGNKFGLRSRVTFAKGFAVGSGGRRSADRIRRTLYRSGIAHGYGCRTREPERPDLHLRIFTGEPAHVQKPQLFTPLVDISHFLSFWTGTGVIRMVRGSGRF